MTGRRRPGRLAALAATLGGLLAVCSGTGTETAAQDRDAARLYLVGEDWIGRWHGSGLAASADLGGATIDSVVPDGAGGVWLLAWPDGVGKAAAPDKPRITRHAAATLAPLPLDRARLDAASAGVSVLWPAPVSGGLLLVRTAAQGVQVARLDVGAPNVGTLAVDGPWRPLRLDAVRPRLLAARWLAPAPMLIGLDSDPAIDPAQLVDARTFASDAAPDWLRPPARLLALSRTAALVLSAPGKVEVVGLDDGAVRSARSVDAREAAHLRGALSPDGGTAIVFVQPPDGGARWPGLAWDAATGNALPSDGLFIDDGSARDPPAARSLACLLPDGKGAIFSLIGAPADRSSEAVLFEGATARRLPLNTAYVQRCVLGEAAKQ
jgi:hypothetical protein